MYYNYVLFSYTFWENHHTGLVHMGIFQTHILYMILLVLVVYLFIGISFKNFFKFRVNKIIAFLFIAFLLLRQLGLEMYIEEDAYREVFLIKISNYGSITDTLLRVVVTFISIFIIYKFNRFSHKIMEKYERE